MIHGTSVALGLTVPVANDLWSTEALAAIPKSRGLFRAGVTDASTTDSLDPDAAAGSFTIHVNGICRTYLIEVTPTKALGPDSAESWEASPDAKRAVQDRGDPPARAAAHPRRRRARHAGTGDRFNHRRLPDPIGRIPPAEGSRSTQGRARSPPRATCLDPTTLRQTRCGSVRLRCGWWRHTVGPLRPVRDDLVHHP